MADEREQERRENFARRKVEKCGGQIAESAAMILADNLATTVYAGELSAKTGMSIEQVAMLLKAQAGDE